jgi:arylformamidase
MYDISMTIESDMLVYKGKDEIRPEINAYRTFENGDVHESELKMPLHTGTHLDAPLHMLENGADSSIFFAENPFYKAQLLDLSYIEDKITAEDLKDFDIEDKTFLLLKTKNSEPGYLEKTPEKFIYLDYSGADYLLEKNVKGIGIDSNGIERNQADHPTHINLLKNNVKILEGVRLNNVPEGKYVLLLSLLKIAKSDGVPARAYLFENGEIDVLLEAIDRR